MTWEELEFWSKKGFFVPWSAFTVGKAENIKPAKREVVTYDSELFPVVKAAMKSSFFVIL